ncbi:DUF2073 domain-containing protein [Candidatus Woesearchaeota archaeon]|nr:DUF2073 domain-containing protein [Candidatus Woesearchaeota archaeon]
MVTLHFVPYTEIEPLSGVGRIRKLLSIAKENKIVLLQGRLRQEEETELIKTTMEEINKEFKGIELAVINPSETAKDGLQKLKYDVLGYLFGDTQGLTIIGPSSIVKKIKNDPGQIELLTSELRQSKASVTHSRSNSEVRQIKSGASKVQEAARKKRK